MADKKKNNQRPTRQKKSSAGLNATIKPFVLLVTISLLLAAAMAAVVHMGPVQQISQQAESDRLQLLADSANLQLTQRFTGISDRLAALAADQHLLAVIRSGDSAAMQTLAGSLQQGFAHSLSLRIIPWDYTATVGLKTRGIELNNSIETLMLTRAGGGRVPTPEAYQQDGQWLISFAQPVMAGNEVVAILLASFDKNLLASVISTGLYRENIASAITHKGLKGKPLASSGSISGASKRFELPFTDGELQVSLSTSASEPYQPVFITLYLLVAAACLVIFAGIVAALLMLVRSLKHDRLLLIQYAESLTGLHRTQPPTLQHRELGAVVDMLTHVGTTMSRNAVVPDDPGQEKIQHSAPPPKQLATADVQEQAQFSAPHIFREYDIRGLADSELNDDNVRLIGRAIGSEAMLLKQDSLVVGRDGRLSSQRIFDALTQGITSTGCQVIDIGLVPTPALYYAAEKSGTGSGVMITASHNPREYNGFKILLQGKTLQGPLIERLLKRIDSDNLIEPQAPAPVMQQDFLAAYIDDVANDILVARPFKVVVDAANGAAGILVERLFSRMNCEIVPLFCEVDGSFPNHSPDPCGDNLNALVEAVQQQQADLGIAFDGDGDRVVAVSASGRVLAGDQLLMLFAQDVVSQNPAATVIYDIKCSSHLRGLIQQFGGRPLQWKTGHANIKNKMQETGALLAGEFSGHYCFKDRWNGFDDAPYAALRLIELLGNEDSDLDARLDQLPQAVATPEFVIKTGNDANKFAVMEKLNTVLASENGEITTLDGIRIDYPDGWGLVRASNTSAALTLRFEATNEQALATIQQTFRQALASVADDLIVPF
ncbi:MAG TPA: phosphomannomutase/phosphoglucomutase [Pseudomonadales bacterium]